MSFRRYAVSAAASAAALFLSACSDSNDPNSAPELPPAESMQIDVSFFDGAGAMRSADETAGAAGTNFIAAAVAVGVARAATFLTLALPAATFAAAVSQTPVFEDGAFHWQYQHAQAGASYQLNLSGAPDGNEVNWQMRVTSNTHVPPLNNFVWFFGTSNLAADAGNWHFFDATNPTGTGHLLIVDWTHVSLTNRSLTLTNVNTNSPDVGDELEFSINGNIHQVQFTDASTSTISTISWNSATFTGYIEAPNVNGGVRACWDATLANTAC